MSRFLLLLFVFSVFSFATDRYLLLPDTPAKMSRFLGAPHMLYMEEQTALVKVPFADIEKFSEFVHAQFGACGGFIDVTEEMDRGAAPAQVVWNEIKRKQIRPEFSARTIRYRADVHTLVKEANAENIFSFLQELTSFPDRSATSEHGLKAAQFLESRAQALAGQLPGFSTRTVATGSGVYSGQPSVVATLPGTNPSLPGLVVGGHMDTYTNAKPGADDDGSGSSVVMELLRAVAAQKAQFERTIHFIWYAAEERGLVGSSYVVDDFKRKNIAVEAAVQFDMVGYKNPQDSEDIYFMTDYTQPELTQTLRNLLATYTTAKAGTSKCGYACSDHANWHRAGFAAAFPFESTFDNMNRRLHTGDDKMAYLDWNHALYFAQLGLSFLGEVGKLQSLAP